MSHSSRPSNSVYEFLQDLRNPQRKIRVSQAGDRYYTVIDFLALYTSIFNSIVAVGMAGSHAWMLLNYPAKRPMETVREFVLILRNFANC